MMDASEIQDIQSTLENNLGQYGLEFHPFKIAWYNALVQPVFKLNFNEDILAFLVVSTPNMFENAFIPFLKNKNFDEPLDVKDPIDECMEQTLSKIQQIFPEHNVQVIHDFEIYPNRKPKLIMQCIAHASGAAYFYHPTSVTDHEWKDDKKMYGVAIHPKYGGWFALRAVVFFTNLSCSEVPRTLPVDVVPCNEDRIKLLELYNYQWEDWQYRDIIPVPEKYSELQIKYFSTPPGNRNEVVKAILASS